MRYVLSAAAACFAASSASAAIDVAAGEACQVANVGLFTCEWLNPDGSVTTSTGRVSITSRDRYLGGSLYLVDAPSAGRVEVNVPYALVPWFGRTQENAYRGLHVSGRYNDLETRPAGTISFQSHFTGETLPPIDATAQLRYLAGFNFYDSRRGNVLSDGNWISSLEWSLGNGLGFNNVRFTVGFTVPEPATWAMFIAGFGLVGAAVRKRRRRAS